MQSKERRGKGKWVEGKMRGSKRRKGGRGWVDEGR